MTVTNLWSTGVNFDNRGHGGLIRAPYTALDQLTQTLACWHDFVGISSESGAVLYKLISYILSEDHAQTVYLRGLNTHKKAPVGHNNDIFGDLRV